MAEIRRELEAVGADEDFIRAELRHWLQSKREGHYAQPASSLELSQAHAVHEPHAPYRGRPDLIVDIPGAPELHIFTDTDISGAASNRLSEMIQTAWHALGIPPLDCPSIPLHLSISADAPSIVEALRKAVSAKVEAARQFLGNESKNREFGRPNDETGEQQPPRDK